LLDEISDRDFHMDSALGLVEMTPEEEAKVRALRWEPIELLKSARADTRIEGKDAVRKRGAPPPSTTRAGIMHMRNASAHTYAMRVKGASESHYIVALVARSDRAREGRQGRRSRSISLMDFQFST
jgi:hypothetical protein